MMMIFSLLLVLLITSTPTITKTGESFKVTFEKGAVASCTYFYEKSVTEPKGDPNFPDGHYKPAKCFFLDPADTSYDVDWEFIKAANDDWTVWAEVQYPTPDGKDTTTVVTNKVEVHR
jgi:hypothetical protein